MERNLRLGKSLAYNAVFVGFLSLLTASPAEAGSKPKPTPPPNSCGGTPGLTTPNPSRRVVVRPIGKIVGFKLPNGSPIDFSADLQSILNNAVTSTPIFSPSTIDQNDPCETHLELQADLTTFQLNVASVGVTFGYSPAGESIPSTKVEGKVGVQIGTIAMDFAVYECVRGQCAAIVPATATQLTAGVDLSLDMNFSEITTGTQLVYNTQLGNVMRKIMNDGMVQLASSDRVTELSWQARVKEYTPAVGSLIFDAGARQRLTANQTFAVIAPTDSSSSGVCNAWKTVAYIHSIVADPTSSTALVDEIRDSRGIQPGDIVMIRAVSPK